MKKTCGVLLAVYTLAASAQSYISPEFLAPASTGGAYVTEATAARVAEVGRGRFPPIPRASPRAAGSCT